MDRRPGSSRRARKLDGIFSRFRVPIPIFPRSRCSLRLSSRPFACPFSKRRYSACTGRKSRSSSDEIIFIDGHGSARARRRRSADKTAPCCPLILISVSSRVRRSNKTVLERNISGEKYFKPIDRGARSHSPRRWRVEKGKERGEGPRPLAALTVLFAHGITRTRVIPTASD